MNDVAYIFVVDGPRFQSAALMLTGSIRVTEGFEPQIIAYCPASKISTLEPYFCSIMEFLKVEIEPIPDQADWNEDYPHGNKILAAAQKRDAAQTIFLDTDVALLGSLSELVEKTKALPSVCAVPEGVRTWGRDQDDWIPVYEMFGLEMPDFTVRLCRGKHMVVLPYFNAGLVSWSGPDSQFFGKIWLDTALQIDRNPNIENKRPWLDQIALPVAMARSKLKISVLEEHYNFSMYRRKGPLSDDLKVTVAHYHIPGVFRDQPRCLEMYHRVIEILPDALTREFEEHMIPFLRPVHASKRS